MSVRKTEGAFADCKRILDLALRESTITIDFDTHAQAVHFRQRCHSYRKRLFDAAQPAPGALPGTPYDSLILRIPAKGEPDDCSLTIEDRAEHGLALLTRIRNAEGQPLDASETPPAEAIAALRGKLGLLDDE